MNLKHHTKQLLQNPKFAKEYLVNSLEHEIARAIVRGRLEQQLTQKELATKLQTKQSVISRIESGTNLPSLSLLKRLADALHMRLEVRLS